ncbi:13429_t:CDS:2 [Cetraspora pellucida]|uniref:13429_t:CDS:1 n=1 Tax=Cetraspora pellucida TaxID=1433469 RepID=A0A9N9NL55_9GLOM|nr:13429_t:CDS:2 [Cetraspora pellucida]
MIVTNRKYGKKAVEVAKELGVILADKFNIRKGNREKRIGYFEGNREYFSTFMNNIVAQADFPFRIFMFLVSGSDF